jgi:hypothetical protein
MVNGFVQIERWTCPFKIFRGVRVKYHVIKQVTDILLTSSTCPAHSAFVMTHFALEAFILYFMSLDLSRVVPGLRIIPEIVYTC